MVRESETLFVTLRQKTLVTKDVMRKVVLENIKFKQMSTK